MINIYEVDPGDVVYFKVSWQKRPVYGEILKIYQEEWAVQVITRDSGYRTVWAPNAFHDEKDAKKAEYKEYDKEHNTYLQKTYAEVSNEKPNDGKRSVHNGKKGKAEDSGSPKAGKSVRRRVKRKS